MRIKEITENQAKIRRVTGDEVEIDQGDGTRVTIDTKKRPDAISRDEKGQLKVDAEVGNSSMNKKSQNQRQRPPRSGERIQVNTG